MCQSLSTPIICYISLSRITVTVMVYRFSAWLVRIPQIPDEITTFFCHLRSQWLRSLGHFKNQAKFPETQKKKKKKIIYIYIYIFFLVLKQCLLRQDDKICIKILLTIYWNENVSERNIILFEAFATGSERTLQVHIKFLKAVILENLEF